MFPTFPTILIEWENLFRIKSFNVAQRCPVKKMLLKILQNLLKNVRDAVFNLIKFHAKGQ